jgi:DNA-binding NarL/FixJ family response regulator
MQFPQILVYESDGLLAAMLREAAKTKRWALREARKPESCWRLLQTLCPTVLVLKIATHAKREAGLPVKEADEQQRAADREKEQIQSLELLARVHESYPEAAMVAVGDAEDAGVASLAWDFGASYVLMPPQSRQMLPEIVVGLMEETIAKSKFGVTGK